ncbi:MAG: ABC-F family ATP-binding cassette domain-containing protein [Deltaproteobacteria bacterium]|nr:ABC-F family ATP-binding cassette domain-containing protein [Deltaproteobacteria bacterium]
MTTLASVNDVSLALGGDTLFDGLSLQVHQGDHIGLVGPNGSGKSSLFRLLAGKIEPDGGSVNTLPGVRVGFLPQEITSFPNEEVLTFVYDSVPGRPELRGELARHEARLAELEHDSHANHDELVAVASFVAELHEKIALLDTEFSEHDAKKILHGLGFTQDDHQRLLSQLSGGWKMRAVLASLLFQRPGLLLLDEPTNHLDMPSVAWFSRFLSSYDQALFLVSHDREFLNEQVNRVVSFEPEGVRTFRGNYERYLLQREEERQLLENRAKNLEKEKEHLEQFVRRFRAKASKAAQVQSRVRKLEKMGSVELHASAREVRFSFPATDRGSRTPMRVDDLCKSFGKHVVFDRVTLAVERGDRIAIVGPNGAGKTTLLKILAGEIEASAGRVHLPGQSNVRYFAQHHAEALDLQHTVLQEVTYASDGTSVEGVRKVLGAMLFGERAIDKRVSVLSGGERARVALAKILVRPGNVLLMDEPTNHLDLQTTEALTDALATYDGTLLFVSHNRAFIRRLATKLWVVHDGGVENYPGTLDDYLWSCQQRDVAPATETAIKPVAQKRSRQARKEQRRREAEIRSKQNQGVKPLEKRVGELERTIARLEKTIAEHNEELSKPEVYDDSERRDELLREARSAQRELERSFEEWTESNEKLEQLRGELESMEG